MEETKKDSTGESMIFGMSVRGVIALLVIFTVCCMSVFKIKVDEPLYTLVGMIMGFFFGRSSKQTGQQS